MGRIAMSQEGSDRLEWLKRARDRSISPRFGRRGPSSMMTGGVSRAGGSYTGTGRTKSFAMCATLSRNRATRTEINMTMMRPISLLLAFLLLTFGAPGESQAPPLLRPDARYKADVLIVVAHPDDDVVVGGYLARISLDERKRIAVVYCTTGDGGGNAVGYEAGAALGQMRILEARRALGAWGIENVWFLTGHDTPGQNVLWSLDSWNHGRALDDIVRIVRLTRPEVIMTWLPNY